MVAGRCQCIAHDVVILLSNIDEASVVQKAKSLGAEDFLVKAKVVPHDTLDKVKEILTARNIPLPKKRGA